MPHGHRISTRLTHLGIVLALVATLTGCSAPTEPVPRSAEPSVGPTKGTKQETAEQFIRRWNDEQREMQKGDTTKYRKIAGECESCMRTADSIDEFYAAGGYVKTEGRSIVWWRKLGKTAGGTIYQLRVSSAPTEYTTRKGAPVQTFDGGQVTYELLLNRRDGRWALSDIWQIPS